MLHPKHLTKAGTNPPWKELPTLGVPVFPEMKICQVAADGEILPDRDEIHHENQEKRKRKPELDPQGPQNVTTVRYRLQNKCT